MAKITSNSITFVDHTGVEKYLYIRYSDDGETFTGNNGLDSGEWLGTCSTNSSTAPTDFNAYTWSNIKGANGPSLYTWIKYADDAEGTNMSDNPDGKPYVGVAYNKETLEESMTASDYTWSLIISRGIDRIEEYYTTTANSTDMPDFTGVSPNEIPTLNATDKKYLWNKEITYFTDGDNNGDETEAVIIGVYGDTGVGISDIINYYQVTPDMTAPISWVPEEAPPMSATDKYLWNYEEIQYTSGDPKTTTPTIIGVYGDEGASAVMFQIYSPKGFEFIDSVEESEKVEVITLETAAFKGSTALIDATYQWFYLDSDDKEVDIEGATESSLVVNATDEYAFLNLGCKMIYDGNTYYDYITLRKKVDVYTASIKFFEGTNVFTQGRNYIVAYVELHKNRELAEGLKGGNKYETASSVDNGIITTNYTETGEEMMYFVYQVGDDYNIVLGKYENNQWVVDNDTKYTYINNLNPSTRSNVFVISRNDINRSASLNIDIYSDESASPELFVASAGATIVDLNDVSVGSKPNSPWYNGQLWFDTANNVLQIYNSNTNSWEPSSQQPEGQSVHTSRPESYKAGDLWILGDNENITLSTNGNNMQYGPGSLLKAKYSSNPSFDVSHWADAMSDVTQVVNNITEYMVFDPNSGLKISQKDTQNKDKFYVNISSTRMSFCSLTDEKVEEKGPDGEVVHISGQSASITNLEVEQSMDCNCPIEVDTNINIVNTYNTASAYPGFVFQIEEDGGFSLVKMEVK